MVEHLLRSVCEISILVEPALEGAGSTSGTGSASEEQSSLRLRPVRLPMPRDPHR